MTEAPVAARSAVRGQTSLVTGIVAQTARIKSFILAPSRPFNFRACQHVDVRLTAADGYRAIRRYSIASAPERHGTIELAVEHLANGEVSPFLHEVVEVGDEIEIRGPLGGHFVWSVTDGGPLLLVAGGSGVVPLMAIIRHREAVAACVPTLLVLLARGWDDVLYRNELLDLHEREDGFMLLLTLTREPPRREGDRGRRVDAAMMAEAMARMPEVAKHIFVCGTNPFVNAAADGAVAAGAPPSPTRTERYGG